MPESAFARSDPRIQPPTTVQKLEQQAKSALDKISEYITDWREILKSDEARKILGEWIASELSKVEGNKVTAAQVDEALVKVRDTLQSPEALKLDIAELRALFLSELKAQIQAIPNVEIRNDAIDLLAGNFRSVLIDIGNKVKLATILNGRIIFNWDTVPSPSPETIFPIQAQKPARLRSVLTADRLDLSVGGGAFQAEGKVSLVDPFGYLRASDLDYTWLDGTMSANDLALRLHPARGSIGSIEANDKGYFLTNTKAGFYAESIKVISGSADRLTFNRDQTGTIEGLKVALFGVTLARIKRIDLNYQTPAHTGKPKMSLLDKIRELASYAQYFRLPTVARSGGRTVYGYSNTLTFGTRSQLSLGVRAAKGKLFENSWAYSYNFSGRKGSTPSVLNPNSIRLDYAGGFVENVDIRSYRDDIENYRTPRSTGLVESSFNSPTTYPDGTEDLISRPYTIGYEFGGPIIRFGGLFQVRYERIESRVFGAQKRFGALGSIALWGAKLANGLNIYAKLDGSGVFPEGHSFGYIRPRIDLVARFLPQLRISAAFANTATYGSPLIPFDATPGGNEIHGRIDLMLGPFQLSYGNRYAVDGRRWYRAQFYISQVVGSFEPYVTYDQYQNHLNFGINFRLDELVDVFQKRRLIGVERASGN